MTPNLTSARQAIQAELSHARQGMAFYSARVEALESALTQLESVEGDESESMSKDGRKTGGAKRGRKAGAAKGRTAGKAAASSAEPARKRGRKPRSAAGAGGAQQSEALPTTGVDFWLDLVSEEPKTAVELANDAAAALGLKPDQKTQIQKLKQRVAPALATLVSSRKIQDSGAGRERRFFKGAENQA